MGGITTLSLSRSKARHNFSHNEVIHDLRLDDSCAEARHLLYIASKLGLYYRGHLEGRDTVSVSKTYPVLYCSGTQKHIPALLFTITVELGKDESTRAVVWNIRTSVTDNDMHIYAPYYNRDLGQNNLNVSTVDKNINTICNKLLEGGLLQINNKKRGINKNAI